MLALIVLAVLASWVVKINRGTDCLGEYAPPQPSQQGSGADHPGAGAPQQTQSAQQPSGADFLGAYAPQRQTGGPASSA
ncbi:hypothetical protein [Streptomyces sp. NPDC050546]|uniref:hypothetical protein n=1 Tax=Streptomyces sp. NPDC050546 TaxID=3365628 RepID=UPI0037B19734